MIESETTPGFPSLSKRAARRLIQRAFVLVGRDRHVRQHVREARLVTLWSLENWKFAWTVQVDRGKIHFQRRLDRRPDLTLTWQAAEEFFRQIGTGLEPTNGFEIEGHLALRKFVEPIFKAFCISLGGLLQNPIDENGDSLL